MAFTAPTELELRSQELADIAAVYGIDPATIPARSFEQAIVNAQAGALRSIYDYQVYLQDNSLPDTELDPYSARWSAIFGVPFLSAVAATGEASATGGTSGTILPQGSELAREDGERFTTDTQVIVGTDGSITVQLTASTPGPDANTAAATELTLVNDITGIPETFTVATAGLVNGANAETQAAHTARRLQRIQFVPGPGLASDYVRWALEATPLVGAAWAYPLLFGDNTVGVFIRSNDMASPVPPQSVVDLVQEYIDARSPGIPTVRAVSLLEIDFTLTLTPDTTAVRAAVENELAAYLFRSGKSASGTTNETTLYLTDISAAIAAARGLTTFTLTAPAANIVVAANQYPVTNDFTYE